MSEVQPPPEISFTSGALKISTPLKGEVGGASHPGVLTSLTLAIGEVPRSGPQTTHGACSPSPLVPAHAGTQLQITSAVSFKTGSPLARG